VNSYISLFFFCEGGRRGEGRRYNTRAEGPQLELIRDSNGMVMSDIEYRMDSSGSKSPFNASMKYI